VIDCRLYHVTSNNIVCKKKLTARVYTSVTNACGKDVGYGECGVEKRIETSSQEAPSAPAEVSVIYRPQDSGMHAYINQSRAISGPLQPSISIMSSSTNVRAKPQTRCIHITHPLISARVALEREDDNLKVSLT
jgi:hypothetical protein